MTKPTTKKKSTLKSSLKGALSRHEIGLDPLEWVEGQLGIELYSNQIDNIETLFDKEVDAFNILACRGAGKTWGLSAGLGSYCVLFPGLRVIVVGPKEKQAGRIIKEIKTIFKSKGCKQRKAIDWAGSSALQLNFKNGSSIVALSGQEGANVEGEHGHILVIDEAHKVPSFSVTNKLTPMVGMLEFSKIIKIGVSMGRNHFYKSCSAESAVVNTCAWDIAESFLQEENPVFYKKRQYSRQLIARMPVPYKEKMFKGRPDLYKETGQEISTLDWDTQYALLWVDDLLNFLNDEDQEQLARGDHKLLTQGMPGELYCAGLDTAQGSITNRKDTDETVLSIWRFHNNGRKEKVASFIWRGNILNQIDEIWEIINPITGLFKCEMTIVDYSNIGINIVHMFRNKGVNIIGKHFQASESLSRKNWKNALYDYFLVQLQSKFVYYPNIIDLDKQKATFDPNSRDPYFIQVTNALRGFWEWTTLQREKGRGINDKIEAPTENVEDDKGSESRAFDDVCVSDVLGVWAGDHLTDLQEEIASGGDLSSYMIPSMTIGASGRAAQSTGGQIPTSSKNPATIASVQQSQESGVSSGGLGEGGNDAGYLSRIMDGMIGKG